MRVKLRGALVGLVAVAEALSGCVRSKVGEAPSVAPPTVEDAGLARCTLMPSQLRPLIVEWSGADRGALELRLRRGVVAVRYEGCTLELLPDCAAPGEYTYSGFTRKRDTVIVRTADELFGEMPIGASRLEAKLARAGELQVDMMLVGEYRVGRGSYTADELSGACAEATHVLSAAQVGAFAFFVGADASTDAAGALAGDTRELYNSDGELAACEAANPGDASAPAQCGALLRLEFSPVLPAAPKPVAVARRPPPPDPVAPSPPPPDPVAAAPEPVAPEPVAPPPSVYAATPTDLDLPPRRRPRHVVTEEDPEDPPTPYGLSFPAGIFGLAALAGVVTIAAGLAGAVGDDKVGRDPSDSFKVAKAGAGITLGCGALSGLLFGLALRRDRATRVGLAPRFGPGFGGASVTLRF